MSRPVLISAAACIASLAGSFHYLHQDQKTAPTSPKKVLVIGSGSAGLAVAHQLKRKMESGDACPCHITIVDPSPTHYYQPLWTLVGASLADKSESARPMAPLIPNGVTLITSAAAEFDPTSNTVGLVNGARLPYDYLVVATGLRTRWDLIPGLEAALDDPKCPVVSIYDFHSCVKTSKFIGEFSAGTALFTQPPQPFKCAGAPQKIMWLAESQWRERGVRNAIEVLFATPIAAMFGIKRYSDVLENLRIQRSVKGLFNTQLVSVNGNDRTAVLKSGDNVVTQKFDLLHVSPPMSAPVCVSSSALADAAGFVDVDKNTMQHVRFPNVFAAGDVGSTPNSKTAVLALLQWHALSSMRP
jgi:NADPH-dependent 2,4-dienoyl-CoA reductase/sulfur reductase-like enzyme